MVSLRLALLGAWAFTALGQQCDCGQCPNYDWTSTCFDNCTVTGDPHVEHSWRKGYENGFDFQPQGIWRLAKTETCGGTVEVQAFFCQYFFTRLSSAIGYAITINNGDKYIVKRVGDDYVIGSPNVESATLKILNDNTTDPAAGIIITSTDNCIRIKLNTQPLYGRAAQKKFTPDAYFNNIIIKVWGCATTEEGICGAEKLSTQYIDPESDANLFKTPDNENLWQDLCEFCQEEGKALTPPGCPAPPGGGIMEPGCEFMRPFGSPRDKLCYPGVTDDAENEAALAALKEDGENCVAFVNLQTPTFPRRTCRDWCQDRGARCVAAWDDAGTGRFPNDAFACNISTATEKSCDDRARDTHCVCEKPDNNAPGESVAQTCADARDLNGFNFSYLDAADMCRTEAIWLDGVTYPQNTEQPTFEQRLLVYCVQDVCATDTEDRREVARSYGDRDPSFPPNKPNLCNGPLLCNLICTAGLIQDWTECMDVCTGHRSMLIHATGRYCKAGLCPSLLQETEIIGLLQHRLKQNSTLEITDEAEAEETESRRSRRKSWSTSSRRSSRSRRSSSSRSRRSVSSRSRRSTSRRVIPKSPSSRSRRSTSRRVVIGVRRRKDDDAGRRRILKDDDIWVRRRIVKDDDKDSRRRILKDDDKDSRRRIVKDDDIWVRRRIVKDDDKDSRRRIVKDDDKDSRRRILKDDDIWVRRRIVKDDDKDSRRRIVKDDDKDSRRRIVKDDDKDSRRRIVKDDDKDSRRRIVKDDDKDSRRRIVKDDDDGSRRRIVKDDDKDSRRRIVKDDDDGSRRRIVKDDDKDSRRRKKDDDDRDDKDDDDDKDKCVDEDSLCKKICYGFKLEGKELYWCLHRCHAKFDMQLKPGMDSYCMECGKYCGHPDVTTSTTTTTTRTPSTEICPFTTTTTTHPVYGDDDDDDGSRRRIVKDDDKDSRRRKADDDDGSRRRIVKDDDKDSRRRKADDDDGSRRRIVKDDDKDSRRRKADDDDGSRRRIVKDDDKDSRRRKADDDDGSRRRIVKDDDKDSRRRIVKDDDKDSRRRIVKDDDDGSRRRIVKDDDKDTRRRKADDDDGTRRRIFKDDDGSRRRIFKDDDGTRRRIFKGDDDDGTRRRIFKDDNGSRGASPSHLMRPSWLELVSSDLGAMVSLRLALLGAWAFTALGQRQCDCGQCPNYDWTSTCFDNCTVTGDPHVEHSWRKGYENGFDFQPQGIWRLAKTETCGGTVEVQAFFCQYFFTRLSSAIGYAITINNGDKYIVKRVGDDYVIGSPNVESATLKILNDNTTDPAAGIIITSTDNCIRIKLNTQPLYGRAAQKKFTPDAYFNNIIIKVWGCATTEEGICGAEKLSTQYIDPESDANLFKTPDNENLWQDLCEFCQEEGKALTPPGCPAPPGGGIMEPGCEFMRPFGSPRDKLCYPGVTDDAENEAALEALKEDGENCVAFVNLQTPTFPRRTCRDWCQDRGARCVAAWDDAGTGRFPNDAFACNISTATEKSCDDRARDTHCVCEKPDNNAPGESVAQTCADARDLNGFNFSYLDAADMCRTEAIWLDGVTYPQNTEQPTFEQRLLVYCVQDVCATDTEDRREVARSYGDRDPSFPPNKPNLCNGPLLCNLICTAGLIQDWTECMDVCTGHRSMLIHATGRYCKAGLCPSLLQETEIIGLLQHRLKQNSTLEITDEVEAEAEETESRRSRRKSWSTSSRRSSRSRRSSSSRSRRSVSSRSRRSTSRRVIPKSPSSRSRRSTSRRVVIGVRRRKDDDAGRRRILKDDDIWVRRRIVKDDDKDSRRRILKDDDKDSRRRIVKDDDIWVRRRIVKDDDKDSRRRIVKDDDKDSRRRILKDDDIWVRRRIVKDDDKDSRRRIVKDDDKDSRRRIVKDDDKDSRRRIVKDDDKDSRRRIVKDDDKDSRRRIVKDDDDGSRRRIVKDDDKDSRRRIVKDDDDGSRRRIVKDDDKDSRRRIVKDDDKDSRRRIVKDDDDGSRRRIVKDDDKDTRRRKADDDDGTRRRIFKDDDGSRRRIFKDDDGTRRRIFKGDDDDGTRRRIFKDDNGSRRHRHRSSQSD
ncbi:eif3a [Symbiodinium sp. CCMP2592]|nr:eif3a [Symbiodinium sp. CCMP2592]